MKKTLLSFITLFIVSCVSDKNQMIVSGDVDGLRKAAIYPQKEQDSTIVSNDSMKSSIMEKTPSFLRELLFPTLLKKTPMIGFLFLIKA